MRSLIFCRLWFNFGIQEHESATNRAGYRSEAQVSVRVARLWEGFCFPADDAACPHAGAGPEFLGKLVSEFLWRIFHFGVFQLRIVELRFIRLRVVQFRIEFRFGRFEFREWFLERDRADGADARRQQLLPGQRGDGQSDR